MKAPIRHGFRIALVLGACCALLAVFLTVRHLRTHQGIDPGVESESLVAIVLALLGCVLFGSLAWLKPGKENPQGLRWTSIVWSVALLAALGVSLRLVIVSNRWESGAGVTIDSPAAFDTYISDNAASFSPFTYRIPTGVFLQSFEFVGPNDIEMSGFVWQKYGPDIPDSVTRGVVFPEQLEDAYAPVEAWRNVVDGVEHIGWYFSGTFRQNFDYHLYPFDRQDVWLRLWHPDDYVLLVPDFPAYRDLDPRTLPGLDTQFVYGGWDPMSSQFSYDLIDYNVDFGQGYGFSGELDPEFYFSVSVARDALGPLLDHMILESVIAILIFMLLLLATGGSSEDGGSGLSVFDLVVASGGLLFAVILDRNAIRDGIETQSVTYLEWLPLILSTFIVLVVLSAILQEKRGRIPILGYNSNRFLLFAYWPALFACLLIVTLRSFFF